jgi:hypothetical protein
MNALNQLPGAPAPAPAPAPVAAPQAAPPTLNPVIVGLASGKIPGLNIPHGYDNPEAAALLKPALAVGLKLFKPVHDKSVQVSVVNPKTVNAEALKVADHHGTLDKLFPSITEFFPHVDAKAQSKAPTNNAPAMAAQSPPTTAAAPAPQPAAKPANGPSNNPVPVMPKQSKHLASLTNDRVKNIQPGTPTSRPIPGGGNVLNGLLKPVI